MSVRKRVWHTNTQVRSLGQHLGVELSAAAETLKRALRDSDTKLLEQYPPQQAWVADYVDQDGDRHIKTFKRKKEAEEYSDQVGVDVRAGVHTPPSKSITVAQAAENWIRSVALRVARRRRWRSTASTPATLPTLSAAENSPASPPPASIVSVTSC